MKKILILIALLINWGGDLIAQDLITVQNGASTKFYSLLSAAITNATDGDTVFLPGRNYEGVIINKRLHLIGVGHVPDSTQATSKTTINGIIYQTGANDGSVTGVDFQNSTLQFDYKMNGYSFSRCHIHALTVNVDTVQNVSFTENIFNIGLAGFKFCYFSNNIFIDHVDNINNSVFRNNIIISEIYMGSGLNASIVASNSCTIENNICVFNYLESSANSTFNNNINQGVNGSYGSNNGHDNIFSIPLDSIFMNYNSATMKNVNGVYNANFHLRANSPYLTAGTGGTEIGIYGGSFPWKVGSVPTNPHIQSVVMDRSTDAHGNLNVQIKVAAQDN